VDWWKGIHRGNRIDAQGNGIPAGRMRRRLTAIVRRPAVVSTLLLSVAGYGSVRTSSSTAIH
jgi:hypothetical protein